MNKGEPTIVLVAQFCDSSVNSTGLYWEQIAERLSKKYKTVVIAQNIGIKVRKTCYSARCLGSAKSGLPKFIPEKLSIFVRLFLELRLIGVSGKHVILGTNPFLLPLLSILIKAMKPKAVTLICYDLFPENIISQVRNPGKKLLALLLKPFKLSYRSFDHVLVVGRDMGRTLLEKGYAEESRIIYAPNWGAREIDVRVSTKKRVDREISFLFFGNLGRFQAIPRLLHQIRRVQRKDVRFVFAGNGEKEASIVSASINDPRIKYIGSVPMEDREAVFSQTDISIVSLEPGMKGFCVPSKTYFALANGHPIIGFVEKGSEIDLFCGDYNCGWIVDIADVTSLSSTIEGITVEEYERKKRALGSIPDGILDGEHTLSLIEQLCSQTVRQSRTSRED